MLRVILCLCALILPAAALANDWDALKRPGAIGLMRHALAPGTGDPAAFDLDDCTTQRNLDALGRDQARAMGAALRARGLTFDAVWTSQWCRCVDTAVLLDVGPVVPEPAVNSFFQERGRAQQQTTDTLRKLDAWSGERLLLVTHQVNITALTSIFPQSGEIIVVERIGNGLVVTGQILIDP